MNAARHVAELLFPSHRGWESEMTEVSRLESRYDAFLFASLCEEDELTLRVLSVLARQDVDPWQEADRLAHLSKEHAINSLASRIWKSNGERWSPSEASILVLRLIELLPSYRGSNPNPRLSEDRNSRMMLWLVVGIVLGSIAVSGNSMKQLLKSSGNPTHHVGAFVQQEPLPQSPHGVVID